MTASYTFDVFSNLDGFGAHSGSWGGYWGKQGPETGVAHPSSGQNPASELVTDG